MTRETTFFEGSHCQHKTIWIIFSQAAPTKSRTWSFTNSHILTLFTSLGRRGGGKNYPLPPCRKTWIAKKIGRPEACLDFSTHEILLLSFLKLKSIPWVLTEILQLRLVEMTSAIWMHIIFLHSFLLVFCITSIVQIIFLPNFSQILFCS